MKELAHELPGLKQFRHESCFSYILFDRLSREALIIDPRADRMDDYRSYLGENGLKPVVALDTHLHSDHFSATHLLRAEYRLSIAMSARTASERADRKLSQGDTIALGALKWTVLETPGHTEDSISLSGYGMVFTGDSLWVSSTGATDSPDASRALWKSLREVLGKLPDITLVFPGHDSTGLLFSTIGNEKSRNRHWCMGTGDLLAELKAKESSQNGPGESDRSRVTFNSASFPVEDFQTWGNFSAQGESGREPASLVTSMNVEKYAQRLKEPSSDVAYIDVREPEEFENSWIPGTVNIPMSEIPLNLEKLRRFKRIYVSCLSGRRSLLVANTLNYLGLPDVVNVLGGLHSWANRGLPLKGRKS